MTPRLLGFACLFVAFAMAQTNRGALSGSITDSSGAAIPSAKILVRNLNTNQAIEVQSSREGNFSVPALDPVDYSIEASAPGFQRALIRQLKVDTAGTTSVQLILKPQSVESSVDVTAELPAINTDSGTVSHTISQRDILNTPLTNRNVLELAMAMPNISGDVGSEDPTVSATATVPGFNISLNGGRPGSTNILADGVNNTGVGLARSIANFSPETVQEVTVQSAAYSAEYGSTGGGIINATTRSGSNRPSGTLLWNAINPVFNAAPWTIAATNRPQPTAKSNQFHGSFGGPVVIPKIYNGRNKTFFFGAFEPRYRMDFVQADALLPTDAMRQGDFSDALAVTGGWAPAAELARFRINPLRDSTIYRQFNLVGNQLQRAPLAAGQTYEPFPGNRIPASFIDPSATKALQYLPQAGSYFLNTNGQLVNYQVLRFVQQNEKRYLLRLDHVVNSKNRFNVRWSFLPVVGKKGFGHPINGNGADYGKSTQLMLSDTHTFSPRILNDLRLNYTRGRFSGTLTDEFDPLTGRNLNAELGLPNITPGGLPSLAFELGAFGGIGSVGSGLRENIEERYGLTDILYFSQGNMNWKFGVDISHARMKTMSLFLASGGLWDFRSVQTANGGATSSGGIGFASFLMGVPNSVQLRNAVIPYYYRWNSYAAFVQNDWKIRRNLTLNLGLRYSLQTPRTEKFNRQGSFLPELAKEYALPSPLTLADGSSINSVLVPPFAYSGAAGRSPYLTPVNRLNFEPRFGFAWSPDFAWNKSRRMAIRGGYGLSHAPLTGNSRAANPDFTVPTQAYGPNSGQTDPNFILRMSSNPPSLSALSPEEVIRVPQDGLVYLDSINLGGQGFVVSKNAKIPYTQNWNLSITHRILSDTIIEFSYVGNKGTHLFMPALNTNPRSFRLIDAIQAANGDPDLAVNDPLGRRTPAGAVFRIQQATLGSQYVGFNRLPILMDSSANSIRHAGFVNVTRRARSGLTLTGNYTFGKSIDDASDASTDASVLTSPSSLGQAGYGAARSNDRSVSSFDVKHNFNLTALYDLPFGRGRRFLPNAPRAVEWLIGGWTIGGLGRIMTGFPFTVVLVDANKLGEGNYNVRPDIAPGVPLLNPLWNRNCPLSNSCEPYLNPAAFMRPVKGALGNAPRTLDGARGPWQQYLNLSLQKNFRLNERVRLQFRSDFSNALNHPVFRVVHNNTAMANFSLPTETPVTAAEFDAWARFNNRPLSNTPAGAALFEQSRNVILSNRNQASVLPDKFFNVPVPQGFARTNALSYDITQVDGFKLYRLRQSFRETFGQLWSLPSPRQIQMSLRIIF
jgi:hypothetical protein